MTFGEKAVVMSWALFLQWGAKAHELHHFDFQAEKLFATLPALGWKLCGLDQRCGTFL